MHNRNKLYVVIKTFHLRLTFNTPCIILENKFPVELVRILIFSWTFKLTTSKNMTVLERITEEQQKNRPSFPCSQFGVLRAVYKDWDVSVESFSAQNYLIATQWCFFFFFFWKNILSPLATCLRKWSSSYLKTTTMKHHRKKFNSYPVADQKNVSYAVYKNKPHFRDGSFKKNT